MVTACFYDLPPPPWYDQFWTIKLLIEIGDVPLLKDLPIFGFCQFQIIVLVAIEL